MVFALPSENSAAFSGVINVLCEEGRGVLVPMMEETLLELAVKLCRCRDLVNTMELLSDGRVFVFKDFYYVLRNGLEHWKKHCQA